MLLLAPVYAAQIVNVEYIHNAIAQKWDITVPYNSALPDPRVAANMKYLLTTIDVANEILNGESTTEYGNGEYATLVAADTIATNNAVEQLIKQSIVYPFTATTSIDTTEFSFDISAAGTFYIDWGDGQKQTVTKIFAKNERYSHRYAKAAEYKIRLGGVATAYLSGNPVISFMGNSNLVAIDGSLGAVFPTLADGRNPCFWFTFANCYNLTSSIPQDLFGGISGPTGQYMFAGTFQDSGVSGNIPDGLFAGISGSPSSSVFQATFAGCVNLTGKIPENLFGNLYGGVDSEAFSQTFGGCTGLTGIPERLFGDITVSYDGYQLASMFYGCVNLTGPSVRINGEYLYDIWPDIPLVSVEDMYAGATGLSDYDNIPKSWGGGRKRDVVPAPDDAEYNVTAITTPETVYFEFEIAAGGVFYIDWGDGNTETFTKKSIGFEEVSHEYAIAGTYNIRIGGQATEYSDDAVISFEGNSNLAAMSGSLVDVFPILPDGTKPKFAYAFQDCTELTSISENLFAGITSLENSSDVFSYTFAGCTGLTSIPENLFAGITSLENSIYVFGYTFAGCTGLTSIPENLFASITSVENSYAVFVGTFEGCTGITAIPENLFASITSIETSYMIFAGTFAWCSGLAGPSARINGRYMYDIWSDVSPEFFYDMYAGCEGLSDYNCIPSDWGGGGKNCLWTDPA